MLKNKSGQISIFIIIGVIMIMVTSFLIFNNDFEFFMSKESKLKNQVSDIVKDCVFDYANNGVFLLGFQAGYINIPDEIGLDFRKYTDFGLKIPNWDSERGDIPTISGMQTDLELFIEENSMSCIKANLFALSDSLNVKINDTITIDAKINDNNVVIEANLPITFNEANSLEIMQVEDYYLKLDSVRLGDLYNLAIQIYNLEENTKFAEDLILDQIYSSSDYSDPDSMPSEGMFYSCSPRVWTIPKLKQNLANLNNNNFKYLYFEGTRSIEDRFNANLNEEFGTQNLRQYFDGQYRFELENTKSSFKNYGVEVVMPSTEMTGNEGIIQKYPYRAFEVTPSSGALVKSMDFKIDAGAKIPIPCIQIFHHLYTLDYDLIVKLTDYNSDGNQYTFQFPLRIEIKNNNPKEVLSSPISNIEPLTANNENYCSDQAKEFPLRIFAKDNQGNFLSDVEISYDCISLSCDLGNTQKPKFMGVVREYAQPYLEANFPYCVGGKVIANKEGYHQGELRIDTTQELLQLDKLRNHEVELTPIKTFDIDLSSFLVVDKETRQGKRVRSEEDGQILVSLENKDLDFISTVIWPNNGGGFYDKLEFLDDESVTYDLTITYSGKDYDLKGYMNIEGFKPDIHSGNNIEVVIPSTSEKITEDNYLDFMEYTQRSVESGDYGLFLR